MSLDSPNRKRESACRKPLFYRDTRYQLGKLSDNRVTRSRKITASGRKATMTAEALRHVRRFATLGLLQPRVEVFKDFARLSVKDAAH